MHRRAVFFITIVLSAWVGERANTVKAVEEGRALKGFSSAHGRG